MNMKTKGQKLSVHLRMMVTADLRDVLEIEEESFGLAWVCEDFMRCLRQRNYRAIVAEYNQRVVGFMVYEEVNDEIQLLNLTAHSGYRRAGVGSQLVTMMIEYAHHALLSGIRVEVRETNLGAQLFFRSLGFLGTDVLREHFNDTSEDAFVMEYSARD